MASISSTQKTHCHARSISLPSRSNQLSEFDEQLCRLRAPEATTSSSSIGHKIHGLKDLYISIENLLLVPKNLRATDQECQNSLVNELLDELLRLLDLCSTTKEALLMTRDSAQELQSVLRRKRGDSFGLMSAIQEYLSQRKNVNKAIRKASKGLRSSETKGSSCQETTEVITLMKEVDSITFQVFESFFSFILGSESREKSNGWFLVSKLMGRKHIACDELFERSEVEKVDAELFILISHKAKKNASLDSEAAKEELAEMDLGLQDLVEGLECLYRHLIKTRVLLLNALNC